MSKAKTLEHVLSKIIVPQYPIIDSVKVRVVGGIGDIYFYIVSYNVNATVDMSLAQEITRETVSLYNMLGEPKEGDLTVYFYDKKGNFAM